MFRGSGEHTYSELRDSLTKETDDVAVEFEFLDDETSRLDFLISNVLLNPHAEFLTPMGRSIHMVAMVILMAMERLTSSMRRQIVCFDAIEQIQMNVYRNVFGLEEKKSIFRRFFDGLFRKQPTVRIAPSLNSPLFSSMNNEIRAQLVKCLSRVTVFLESLPPFMTQLDAEDHVARAKAAKKLNKMYRKFKKDLESMKTAVELRAEHMAKETIRLDAFAEEHMR